MDTHPSVADEKKLKFDRQILAYLENISEGLILLDACWRSTYLNRAAEIILHKKRADMLDKNVWEIFPEAVGTTFWAKYHEARDLQTIVEFEDYYPPCEKWFHVRVSPSEAGVAVTFQDITEREHGEEDRQRHEQSAQLQAQLVELAHDAIIVRDPTSTITSWNKGAEELYGWTAQEAIGHVTHTLLQTVFPVSREALDALLAKSEQWEGELVHTRKDETRVIVESRQVIMRNHLNQPIAILETNRDITERKQRERENQEQYRTIVQTANEGIWLIDSQAQTLYCNGLMALMLGYSVEELTGRALPEFVFPDDLPQVQARIDNTLRGAFEQFDFRFQRKDGRPVYVLACTSPVRDGREEITATLGMFTDLTERKRGEEQEHVLAEVSKVLTSTLDYQETLANIARLVVPELADWFAVDLVDVEGHFELIEIAHKDPEQVRWARALREHYPVDPSATTGAPRVFRTGQSELYAEITDDMLVAAARNEEELAIARQIDYTSVMLVPLVARGKTLGVVTFVATESGKKYDQRDIALAEEVGRRAGVALDNARLYREVAQARDQLDIILQGVADGIIVYDARGQIIYANEAAAQMTGSTSVQDILGTPPLGIVARYEIVDEQGQPFPPSQLTHRRVLAGEQQAQAIIGYAKKASGPAQRWSLLISRPVSDVRGELTMVITIIHDITERMQSERRKDEFISITSHELKTPVTSLKGFTNVLQRRLAKQGDEQGMHYLARMDVQLNKLTKIISDLLDLSRMQTGKLALLVEAFELDQLVHETVENVQAATTTHQLLIEGRTDAQVLGDKDRLGQVFINLLNNAVKYSPDANKVLVRLSREHTQVLVRVQDFGIGIDETHHQKIFERFYQVTDPEEKTYPGLGIGLNISIEIVERHNGRIEVQSRKGEGATFSIILPLYQEGERTDEFSLSGKSTR